MFKSAVFSTCERYRYQLERRHSKRVARKSTIAFIGLNPSTADASEDDPTIRRMTAFALQWKFEALIVVNLFAWRATEPAELRIVRDPIGLTNDEHIAEALERASKVIACWGEYGVLHQRALDVSSRYKRRLYALKLNQSGQPSHPLYLPATLKPVKLSKLEMQNRS